MKYNGVQNIWCFGDAYEFVCAYTNCLPINIDTVLRKLTAECTVFCVWVLQVHGVDSVLLPVISGWLRWGCFPLRIAFDKYINSLYYVLPLNVLSQLCICIFSTVWWWLFKLLCVILLLSCCHVLSATSTSSGEIKYYIHCVQKMRLWITKNWHNEWSTGISMSVAMSWIQAYSWWRRREWQQRLPEQRIQAR